jgi:hypothetical protein
MPALSASAKWLLGVLTAITLLGVGANWLSAIVFGQTVPGWQDIVVANWPWAMPAYLIALGAVYWTDKRDRRRALEVELLLKTARQLKPEEPRVSGSRLGKGSRKQPTTRVLSDLHSTGRTRSH